MNDYTIADLYAAQSYFQAKVSHPLSPMLSNEDFIKLHKDLDLVTTELRKMVEKMIDEYDPKP